MLTMIITGIIIALIVIAAVVMHYLGGIFSEFEDHFLRLTVIILIFFIGAAIYLSHALPTVAQSDPYSKKTGDIRVYRDTPSKSFLEEITGM
jgi:hypothetical protein